MGLWELECKKKLWRGGDRIGILRVGRVSGGIIRRVIGGGGVSGGEGRCGGVSRRRRDWVVIGWIEVGGGVVVGVWVRVGRVLAV